MEVVSKSGQFIITVSIQIAASKTLTGETERSLSYFAAYGRAFKRTSC